MHYLLIRGNRLLQKGSFAQFLSFTGTFLATVGAMSVFANNAYHLFRGSISLSLLLFLISFLLAAYRPVFAFIFTVTSLPLVGNLSKQLELVFGISILTWVNPGLDLVAGCYLGWFVNQIRSQSPFQFIKNSITSMPWPVGLVLSWIALSTALAISRNVMQSAARTDLKGAIFNFVHFRPMGWHDDYYPIVDLIAYSLAGALVMLAIFNLAKLKNRDVVVFRSLIFGLLIAVLVGFLQSISGLGLPEALKNFRRDFFGYVAIGLQPDLHAYAGHMLLGAVGLWGYFQVTKSPQERFLIVSMIALSWLGLILSKSRSTFLIAMMVSIMGLVFILNRDRRSVIGPFFVLMLLILILLGISTAHLFFDGSLLGWVSDLIDQLRSKDTSNLHQLGGVMGSRFEIWSAAFRMIDGFPLAGVGQGEFYRLSENVTFSKSHFLYLNHGENAHNYFLQTFAELGFVGVVIFAIAIFYPICKIASKRNLIPATVGLVSLFLGNIFSHSFLVRENLLLGAVLIGLAYAWLWEDSMRDGSIIEPPNDRVKNHHSVLKGGVLIGISALVLSVSEVVYSWNKAPFTFGALCQKIMPLSDDGWSSGAYELILPAGVRGVKLPIKIDRPKLERYPLEIRSALFNSRQYEIPASIKRYDREAIDEIELLLPNKGVVTESNVKLRLDLSSCYTPRNLGVNTDSRKLGLIIGSPEFIR